jgi:xanthine dehydrogenase accessory factor
MEGSIGGGIMEYKFVEMAKEKLRITGEEPGATDIKKQYHDKSAKKDQSGMICSGEQTILLYHAKEKDKKTVHRLLASLEKYENATLMLSPNGMSFEEEIPVADFEYVYNSEDDWLYREKTGYKNQLMIIGGGHCALALSALMRSMDFYIRVFDERKELKTMVENEAAHEKHFVNDYAALKERITGGNNCYAVIMTFGYRSDDIALRALLGKDFRYLGLLGSKTKIEKMFAEYRAEGIEEKLLQPVYTPIGLQIKSQTPEEIAVSIAAEIIKVKNR